jgi:hypothetical protein
MRGYRRTQGGYIRRRTHDLLSLMAREKYEGNYSMTLRHAIRLTYLAFKVGAVSVTVGAGPTE